MPDITTGPALTLGPNDFARAAAKLACDPAAVRAVCRVEAACSGFLADGRPKVLFEAQVFHRLTAGRFVGRHPNISSPVWDRSLYGPAGAHQHDRLAEALALDAEAALQSASWGLFQILGANFRRCGFLSVRDFVTAMQSGAAAHLDAFTAVVASDPRLLSALRRHDWPTFARLYNGPGYADNHYDSKLAAAYRAETAEV